MEDLVGHLHVVAHEPFHPDPERREQQAPVDALLVHHPQANVTVPIRGRDGLELAVPLLRRPRERAVPVAGLQLDQPVVEDAGFRDRIERGVRQTRRHAWAEHDVAPVPVRDPPHVPLDRGVTVASERVLCLVVVVVGVEHPRVHATAPVH